MKGRARSPEAPDLGGIVLAGGSGRRFGRSKASVVLDGRTLVERAVEMLRPHCRTLLVVARPGVSLPALDAPVRFDREGPDAPLNALATGLSTLETSDTIVLACDLPAAGPLVARLASVPAGAVAMAREAGCGRWQPLCARYPRLAALDVCERLLAAEELRLLALVDALRPSAVVAGAWELTNVNTPADLARLSAFSRQPAGC